MLGRAMICSDAAAEPTTYGFTAVDRPDGFLVLAIASLGEQITEYNRTPEAEEVKTMEERKGGGGVKGLGERKQMNQSTLFGRMTSKSLVVDWHPQSTKIVLEYNEYAAYDPNQVSIRFLVAVKYEEQGVKKGRNPGSEKT